MDRTENEADFERTVAKWLEEIGWTVRDGTDEPFLESDYTRNFDQVIYWDVLKRKLTDINECTTEAESSIILNKVKNDLSYTDNSLLESNKQSIEALRRSQEYTYNGELKTYNIIDHETPENNEYCAITQFTYKDAEIHRRPDIVLFINGIPVSVLELKSVNSLNKTTNGINQIKTYENEIKSLFVPNVMNVSLNENEVRYGSLNSPEKHFHYWREDTGAVIGDVKINTQDLLKPTRILDFIKQFTFFKSSSEGWSKIIPRHQQYYSACAIVEDVLESEENNTVGKDLIVHVQGSGKTYAMIFASHILSKYHNYPVFLIVDRTNLTEQFGDDLKAISEVNQTVIDSSGTTSGSEKLKQGLDKPAGIFLSTLQLFNNLEDTVQKEKPSVVFADEAHRFMEDQLGDKLKQTFEPFHYYGFTGTPLDDTYKEFSDIDFEEKSEDEDLYLHKYGMSDAIDEGAILPVDMVSRKDKLEWNVDVTGLDSEFEDKFGDLTEKERQQKIFEELTTEDIARIDSRMDVVVDDIAKHFVKELRSGENKYKGMVVTTGRETAAKYTDKLKEILEPEYSVDTIYSTTADDSEIVRKYKKSDKEIGTIIDNFKEEGSPHLLVVCDMLRTGFDAPLLRTIYLDRKFTGGHTLLQTISRTNRTQQNKSFGEIIDYQGVTEEFDELVNYDDAEIESFKSTDKSKFKDEIQEYLNELQTFFDTSIEELTDINTYVNQLDTPDKQDNYIYKFEYLRRVYSSVGEDQLDENTIEQFKKYKQIYSKLKTELETDKDSKKKDTLDIIEGNVNVNSKSNYETTERRINGSEDITPSEVSKKRVEVNNAIIEIRRYDNRYEKLSEKLQRIINRWNQDVEAEESIDYQEANEKLEEIKQQVQKISEEIQSDDLTKTERSLKQVLLKDEYDIDASEDSIEEAVKLILEKHSEQKPSVKQWWTKDSKRRIVEEYISDILYDTIGPQPQRVEKDLLGTLIKENELQVI